MPYVRKRRPGDAKWRDDDFLLVISLSMWKTACCKNERLAGMGAGKLLMDFRVLN